jgi:hypothetical protein
MAVRPLLRQQDISGSGNGGLKAGERGGRRLRGSLFACGIDGHSHAADVY